MCVRSVGAHVPATTWQGGGECANQNNDLPKTHVLTPGTRNCVVLLDKGALRLQI